MSSSPAEIRKHRAAYWLVGDTLCLFTVITVLVSLVPALDIGAPGRSPADIVLALCIAAFKSSLVVLIFMHLNHERGLIYKTLLFTAVFAAGLMLLTLFSQADHVRMPSNVADQAPEAKPVPRAIHAVGRQDS